MPQVTRPQWGWRHLGLLISPETPYAADDLARIAEVLRRPLSDEDAGFLQETAQLYLIARHDVDEEPRAAKRAALSAMARSSDPLAILRQLDDASRKELAAAADLDARDLPDDPPRGVARGRLRLAVVERYPIDQEPWRDDTLALWADIALARVPTTRGRRPDFALWLFVTRLAQLYFRATSLAPGRSFGCTSDSPRRLAEAGPFHRLVVAALSPIDAPRVRASQLGCTLRRVISEFVAG